MCGRKILAGVSGITVPEHSNKIVGARSPRSNHLGGSRPRLPQVGLNENE